MLYAPEDNDLYHDMTNFLVDERIAEKLKAATGTLGKRLEQDTLGEYGIVFVRMPRNLGPCFLLVF